MYQGKRIWRRLNKNTEWMQGQVTAEVFLENTRRMIAPFGVRLEYIYDFRFTSRTPFKIGGEYDPYRSKQSIAVIIHLNPANLITFTQNRKRRFLLLLNQTLQHEKLHQYQFARRGENRFYAKVVNFYKCSSKTRMRTLEYFANVDEIDAYAHDLAMEIKFHYPHENPYFVLNNINKFKHLTVWNTYKKAFKGARWVHIREELLRKTNSWLPTVKDFT